MNSLLMLLVFVFGLIVIDHIKFWHRTSIFMRKAQDLVDAYNNVLDAFKTSEQKEISFKGLCYKINVKNGDYRSFVLQIQLLVCDVLDSYDAIGERYLFEMDDDLRGEIELIHYRVEKIDEAVRITIWQNEWK